MQAAAADSEVPRQHCLWQGCGKHFQNALGLSSHITCHLNDKDLVEGKFVCLWAGCNQHLEWVRKNCLIHLQTHAKLKTKRMAKASGISGSAAQTAGFSSFTTGKASAAKSATHRKALHKNPFLPWQPASSKRSVPMEEDELEEDVDDESQDDQPLMLKLSIPRTRIRQEPVVAAQDLPTMPLALAPRFVGLADVHHDTESHLKDMSKTLKSMVGYKDEDATFELPVARVDGAEELSFEQKAEMRRRVHETTTRYLGDVARLMGNTESA